MWETIDTNVSFNVEFILYALISGGTRGRFVVDPLSGWMKFFSLTIAKPSPESTFQKLNSLHFSVGGNSDILIGGGRPTSAPAPFPLVPISTNAAAAMPCERCWRLFVILLPITSKKYRSSHVLKTLGSPYQKLLDLPLVDNVIFMVHLSSVEVFTAIYTYILCRLVGLSKILIICYDHQCIRVPSWNGTSDVLKVPSQSECNLRAFKTSRVAINH